MRYIGVTGFTDRSQVMDALAAFPPCDRKLMVGVLTSSKTLLGWTNKYLNRYPPIDKIGSIFVDHPRALNLVHYSTDDPSSLGDQLLEVAKYAGPHLHGFQLNAIWPLREQVRRGTLRMQRVVLQVGRRAMDLTDSITELAVRIHDYEDVITDVLLDVSGGRGVLIDVDDVLPKLQKICALSSVGYGVAGGLSSYAMDSIHRIASKFPNVNIDAESRLRNEDDTLDMDAVVRYLEAAVKALPPVSKK